MPLSEAERRALERLVAASSTPQALALRARIVLASAEESISTVARSLGVSRNTALKWQTRFDADGVQGLADLPRPGRPTAAGDDVHRAILRTPLQRPPERGWTTRTIAAALGTNQAAVSRVRRQWFADRPDLVSHSVLDPSTSMVLAAVVVDPGVRVLVFHEQATPAARPKGTRTSPLTEPVRVLLSARFAFPCETPATGRDISPTLLTAFGDIDAAVPQDRSITVLVDRPSPTRVRRWLDRHPRFGVYEVGPDSWLAQLNSITEALDPRQSPELLDLEQRVRRWAEQPSTPFSWVRASSTRTSRRSASGPATEDDLPRSLSPRLASAVVEALRESLATGAFRPGQRIAEQPLATRLGVSRGPIRDALKILAEDGLIELEPHRGAYVPLPTQRDVFDTYTARGPLGALLLRRVSTNGSSRLVAAKDTLDDIVRLAEMRDVAGAGDADIRWQDALAAAADMPRIEKMFVRLSLQLRMFVSILGLEYAYPVDEIVADNTAILHALEARDPEEVTRLWRRKIDKAVTYMVGQLGHLDVGPTTAAPATGGPG